MAVAKRMFITSLRLLVILTAIDLALSVPLAYLFGGVEASRILGLLGDLTILEALAFFVLGASLGLYDVGVSRPVYDEDDTVTRIPYRGGWFLAMISRRRKGTNDEGPERMEMAMICILCGAMFFALTVALAKIAGF